MGELRPTRMSVQLADRSVKFPVGMLENVPVRIDVIDVKKGKLNFEVGEEKVEFILTQFLNAPAIDDTRCLLDIIDECIRDMENEQTSYSEILKVPRPPTFKYENLSKE
ncbi:uncharacterized protein LOC127122966 [Lathyrus oleraceus]|uniref:uncharacterized protein LOC127122966 n=1 Tax=Pisum sativum TaxID=3888 RepID=UPI0021D1FE02|nr:uncharacterized protein LOC127122966 [Pisum sativum]